MRTSYLVLVFLTWLELSRKYLNESKTYWRFCVCFFFRSSVQDRGAILGSLHEVDTDQKVGLMWMCVVCGCMCMWDSVSHDIHIILLC